MHYFLTMILPVFLTIIIWWLLASNPEWTKKTVRLVTAFFLWIGTMAALYACTAVILTIGTIILGIWSACEHTRSFFHGKLTPREEAELTDNPFNEPLGI